MLIDNLGNQEYRYEFYLCKSFYPHEIMSCITECSFNRSLKFQLMSVDEIELDIANIYNDGSTNESFDLTQIANTIKVETYIDDTLKNTQLFHIYQLDQVSGDKDIKSIKGYSLEYRFNKLKVRNFKATTFLYKNVPFDYETPTNSGIMDYLLELLEHTWTISYVTPDLLTSARSYDISESNLLDTINTIQSNYNAIFFYDTINRTIQIKSISELNEYSGIVLSTNNYIKQYKNSIKMDEIYTRLYITGSGTNSTGISSINVTGKPYLDNFSAFMITEFMSSGLISALTTLNNLRLTKQTDFNNYLIQLSTKQGELDILNVAKNTLLNERKIIENHEDTCIKFGTSSGNNYSYWHGQYTTKQSAISINQGLINSKEAEIIVVNGNITTLVNLVSYETNLTLLQRQELLNFINETSVKFDTDQADTLMLLGTQLLNIKSSFQYDIEIDMVDIYSAQSESVNWNNIVLGKKANINLEDLNVELEPMIVAISHGYDNNSLNISVSNKTYLNGDLEYISAIFASSKKASTILENEKDIYTQFDEVKNNVIYDTTPISTTNNPITLEDGSALLRRGIYMRDSTDALGQMKILGDRILFTRDNWNNLSVGITSLGITTSGSFKLLSENLYGGNNLLTLDGNGIKIYGNGVSGDSISIYNKANQQTFGLDSNGNMKMYTGSISWTDVNTDPVATNAASTASTANSTANSALTKAQQIANGTYSGGTFIDGKIVYSPTILNNKVGMTDTDANGLYTNKLDSDIRIWAGDSYANRASAPFRVSQAGIVYMTGAVIDSTTTLNGTATSTVVTNASNSVQKDTFYNRVKLSSANGIQVFDTSNIDRVKIGQIDTNLYGIQLKNSSSQVVMSQDSNGNLGIGGKLYKVGSPTTYTEFSGAYGDLTSYYNDVQFFKLENLYGGLAFKHENKEHFSVGANGFIFGNSSQHTNVDFSYVDTITGFSVKFS